MREKESGRRIKVNHDVRAVIFTEERVRHGRNWLLLCRLITYT
jgi:hypothetical protein